MSSTYLRFISLLILVKTDEGTGSLTVAIPPSGDTVGGNEDHTAQDQFSTKEVEGIYRWDDPTVTYDSSNVSEQVRKILLRLVRERLGEKCAEMITDNMNDPDLWIFKREREDNDIFYRFTFRFPWEIVGFLPLDVRATLTYNKPSHYHVVTSSIVQFME